MPPTRGADGGKRVLWRTYNQARDQKKTLWVASAVQTVARRHCACGPHSGCLSNPESGGVQLSGRVAFPAHPLSRSHVMRWPLLTEGARQPRRRCVCAIGAGVAAPVDVSLAPRVGHGAARRRGAARGGEPGGGDGRGARAGAGAGAGAGAAAGGARHLHGRGGGGRASTADASRARGARRRATARKLGAARTFASSPARAFPLTAPVHALGRSNRWGRVSCVMARSIIGPGSPLPRRSGARRSATNAKNPKATQCVVPRWTRTAPAWRAHAKELTLGPDFFVR